MLSKEGLKFVCDVSGILGNKWKFSSIEWDSGLQCSWLGKKRGVFIWRSVEDWGWELMYYDGRSIIRPKTVRMTLAELREWKRRWWKCK